MKTAWFSLAVVFTLLPLTTLTPEIFTTFEVTGEPSKFVTVTGEFSIGDTFVVFPWTGVVVIWFPIGTVVIGVFAIAVCFIVIIVVIIQ